MEAGAGLAASMQHNTTMRTHVPAFDKFLLKHNIHAGESTFGSHRGRERPMEQIYPQKWF